MKRLVFQLIFVAILAITSTRARAQYFIQGSITNKLSETVPGAIITLENAEDSSLVLTTFADQKGKYTFSIASILSLNIKVTADGFITQQQTIADTSVKKQTIDFILLPNTKELGPVTVSSSKPLFERKVDRTIFNVSSSIASIGGTALDAVKKAPGVLVSSQENSISLVGKSQVQVMVNDRLIQLSGEDLIAYLQSIPSDNIERIEVITTPPAQYDAAGSTGLLNIVLKKNKKNGISGDVRAGYEQSAYATGIGGGSLNYKRGKLNVFSSLSYSNGSKDIFESVRTEFPNQYTQINDPYKRTIRNTQYSVGADYELNKKSTISIQLTGTDFKRKDVDITDLQLFSKPQNTLDSLIQTRGISHRNNSNNIANVNYTWNIDTSGKKLTVNVAQLWFDGSRDRDYDTQNYYGLSLFPTGVNSRNQNLGVQKIRITTAQADAELPYKWAAVSVGGRLSFTNNDSRNNFLYYDNGAFKEDFAVSNSFNYKENVQAIYVSAAKTLGKFDMRTGLRGEWTQTNGYSAKMVQTNFNSYFNLFPTAYLQYKENDNHIFNLNYSRRINRPGYRALDPYRSYSTPYSYTEGNPFLQPAITDNVELGYTLNGKYSITAFYQYEPNTFSQLFHVDSALGATYSRFENYGNAVFYGVNLNGAINPVKSWEMQAQTGFNLTKNTATYTTHPQSDKPQPTYYISVNNTISLNKSKTLVAQANVFYISSYLNDLLQIHPQCNVDAGMKAFFLDKKLILSLNANDIFRTLTVHGDNPLTGQSINNYFDERNVRMTLNYKFGNNKPKRERSTGVEEEGRRM